MSGMQLERSEVWRAQGAANRSYHAEPVPTNTGQDRWHVSVVDPLPANIEYSDQAMVLYKESGSDDSGLIRTL